MAGIEERRVHVDRQPAVAPFGGADQLQAEAQLARIGEVVQLQLLDAFIAHVVQAHRGAERQAREDRHLGRRVAPADVVVRIGLGVAPGLGLRERLVIRVAAAPSR